MAIGTERFFLFTDIEGSTQLWERAPVAMRQALAHHDALLREAAETHGGHVFKTMGDAFCIAFSTAEAALKAALQAQYGLLQARYEDGIELKVRMALHGGEVERRDNDYFGPALNRVSRLRDAGHGGQLLASSWFKDQLAELEQAWRDHGLHRLRGIAEPEQIFQYLAEGLPEEFPLLRTESAHPHNLPSETTAFVGRRSDLLALRTLLVEKRARLVTVTGFGGSGKSRLALRTASDILWHYSDGVWYVDALLLTRPEELASAVLSACGLQDDPKRSPLQQLTEHFRTARALLVIDGAERFEELADELAALLKGTENLQVLAASRSLLYLSMEFEYALAPLSVAESVALFEERATQARRDFALTDSNRGAIEAIVARLEGNPLALELAAAQIRSLSPEEIVEALQERFAVLASRMRDLHPRHRSLRSTIDWSYQTLNAPEQRLFASLSCFVGGFTVDAAQAVCGELCAIEDIPGTLTSLRDKSLLRLDAPADTVRYLLQDSLREFGAEALQSELPEQVGPLQERHAHYFHTRVLQEEPELRGAHQQAALSRLERDAPNIRAVLERSLTGGRPTDAARLATGLWRFWEARGWGREGRERVQRILKHASKLTEPRTHAELLLTAGRLEWNGAAAPQAVRHLERCVALCQEGGFDEAPRVESTALTVLGMIAYSRGELVEADRYYEAALPLKAQIGDTSGEAALRTNLGINALTRGDYPRAMGLFEEILTFRQQSGDTAREAQAWNCIGATAQASGDHSRAQEAFQKSFAMYQQLGDPVHAAHAQINIGVLALQAGDPQAAAAHFESTLPPLRAAEDLRGITACQIGRAEVALATGADARPALSEALAISLQNGYQENLATVLELLAQSAAQASQRAEAGRFLAGAVSLRQEMGVTRPHAPESLLGQLHATLGPLPTLTEIEREDLLSEAQRYASPTK